MSSDSIQFSPGSRFTLGVEIEFQILDSSTLALAPLGPQLQRLAPELLRPRISQELITSILEIQTGICRDLRDVENDLMQTGALAEELAAENGCLLYAASLHPFARAEEQEFSTEARYQRILEELQLVGRRFISQGLHVHVGVPDGETAVRVCNTIQAYLPIFLALSASSPFYQGIDTGLMSYRTKLFESLPLAGQYEFLQGWDDFCCQVEELVQLGIIESVKDLWWDARPNPGFGTVEVRVCDLPVRFGDILSLTALIQACTAWIAEEGSVARRLNPYLLRANKWQAVRHGLKGRFVDPTADPVRSVRTLADAAAELMAKLHDHGAALGSSSYLEGLERIIAAGTGADIQRRNYYKLGSFTEVIAAGHREFWG